MSAGTTQLKVTLNGKTITGTVRVVGGTATISSLTSLRPSASPQAGGGQLINLAQCHPGDQYGDRPQQFRPVVSRLSRRPSRCQPVSECRLHRGGENTAGQATSRRPSMDSATNIAMTVTGLPTAWSRSRRRRTSSRWATTPWTVAISTFQVGPTVVLTTSTPVARDGPTGDRSAGQTTVSFTVTSVVWARPWSGRRLAVHWPPSMPCHQIVALVDRSSRQVVPVVGPSAP